MLNNVVSKSVKERERRLIEEFKFLTAQIKEYEIALETRKRAIMNLFELQGIVNSDGVRIVEENHKPRMTIGELKEVIRNEDILDSLVIDLDVEGSIDNLNYIENIPEVVAKNIGETLKTLPKYKVKDLKIGK